MNRVIFLVDGFNLYHSVSEAGIILKSSTKWLDIKKLCSSYLYIIKELVGEKTELKAIYYFSAFARHIERKNPGVTERHKQFIECLKDSGIKTEMSRFKPKKIKCPNCKKKFTKHEEKETDVALGLKLIEIFINNECDTAVLLTGDTDLVPAFKTAHKLFPKKRTLFAFPFKRKNNELSKLAPGSFNIKPKQYVKYQFPNLHRLSNGKLLEKPKNW